MKKKSPVLWLLFMMAVIGCATFQSAVKSTFPYTATLTIPKSSPTHTDQLVYGEATSFDQDITKSKDTGARVREVRVASARLESKGHSDFNIGNLVYAKVYFSKPDGGDEILVASRTDIIPDAGRHIVLDINDTPLLDRFIHLPKIKVRMAYQLRNQIDINAKLFLILGISASAGN